MSLAHNTTESPPPQSKPGEWTEKEYLGREFGRQVEYVDRVLEFLPMPTFLHQLLVAYLHRRLVEFIGERGPFEVFFSPIFVRTLKGKIREPADLVMEVVSGAESDRDRDSREKREEYAAAGTPEYWIVDPATGTITVLTLKRKKYLIHGEFQSGTVATSALLPGFQIDVADAFAVAKVK